MSTAPIDQPEAIAAAPPVNGRVARFLAWCTNPPRGAQIAAWCLIVAALVGVRLYLLHTIPFYLWSKDGGSYADSAWRWFDTGVWETDPRRGPVYSLLIAYCLNVWGTFFSLMVVQHLLGAISVLAAIVVLWRLHSIRAWLALTACSIAYALYAGPVAAEHIVRNESLILLFATATLVAAFTALRLDSLVALILSGLAFGMLVITKNVFAPFPLVILIALVSIHWHNRRRAILTCGLFVLSCALPLVGNRVLTQLTVHTKPREPQAGLLLFARVAQFTVLENGIEPELKALIKDDIVEYQKRPRLDNNIILNRTAIPRMREHLLAQGRTPADLNRVCRALAFEAIRAHPQEYKEQIWNDCEKLHRSHGERLRRPDRGEIEFTIESLAAMPHPHATLRRDEMVTLMAARNTPETFRIYERLVAGAWLFNYSPVLLTSVLLPVMILFATGTLRWWWLSLCAVWYFNVILLSTVGKPMDRYLVPVMPVMFWTLGSAVAGVWSLFMRISLRLFSRRPAALFATP
jgi:hypothetical protein